MEQQRLAEYEMEQQRLAEHREMQQHMEAQEEREAEMLRQLAQLRQAPPSPTPPAAMHLLPQRSTGVKIEYKEFSGELEDWNTWSKVHHAQFSALGGADVLTAPPGQDITLTHSDFDHSGVDPERLRRAE